VVDFLTLGGLLNFSGTCMAKSWLETHAIAVALKKRFSLFSPLEVGRLDRNIFVVLLAFVCSFPWTFAQQLLHTWANGWCTSHGMRESEILPCLGGCVGEQDSLKHFFILFPIIFRCFLD